MGVGLLLLIGVFASAGSGDKTAFNLDDIVSINLKQSDIPKEYRIRASKTGLKNKAVDYAEGEKESAKKLEQQGWAASDEIYFETGDEQLNIYAALSLYKDVARLDCSFERVRSNLLKEGAVEIKNAKKLEQKSVFFKELYKDPKWGEIVLYEVRFYYGNVFANVEIGGPEKVKEDISQKKIEKYAAILERRLKKGCPQCEKAPPCTAH